MGFLKVQKIIFFIYINNIKNLLKIIIKIY